MEENTEYKSFASLEQSNPDITGITKYYNTVRTLAATKNDCATGSTGNTITLTANANQFASTISIADANAQADAWLTTNVQAYANNSGTCRRITAWRGINPTCIIEPTTTLSNFNYMVVRYKWALGAGVDFDTFTGFINTGTEWDNKYMGYGHQQGNELPNGKLAADSYIMWAGDNTQSNGVESCLVNFSKMTTDYPNLNTIQVRMAGAWFNSVGTGNIDIEVTTYLGGTMSKVGYDIINTGGTQVQKETFSKHIPKPPNWVNDVNAVTNIGYVTFTKSSSTGRIVITY
ncbi:DUF5977 domain-containing protein [Flavobacterium sp. LS1R49]|uniref:DUF5977 domain-containing protein n=1 Tax=Flavobacterium shii TaxID=2987687 RepID=A0A9X2ZE57_9FLAO|nr:DUF5977 domain-containing protein [Flavobacterium shii]MCV9928117.1 DUF5977 domain-containing protein [Flavobacterium shii]